MRPFTSLLGALLVTAVPSACDRDSLTSPRADPQALQLQRQSGCRHVAGTITESLTGPNTAAGTIEGDLAGNVSIVITFGPVTGKVQHFTAAHAIGPITGGSVPDLVGVTLRTSDEGMLVGDPPVFLVKDHLTVVGGGSGKLKTHGTLDVTVASDQVQLSYRGVVCP